MLSIELGGKTLSTTSERMVIHINGMLMEITGDAEHVYVNGKCVNKRNLPVLELLGLGIVFSLWYTLIFTKYGAEFMMLVLG